MLATGALLVNFATPLYALFEPAFGPARLCRRDRRPVPIASFTAWVAIRRELSRWGEVGGDPGECGLGGEERGGTRSARADGGGVCVCDRADSGGRVAGGRGVCRAVEDMSVSGPRLMINEIVERYVAVLHIPFLTGWVQSYASRAGDSRNAAEDCYARCYSFEHS